jgi:pSer/pThr/pTyr-binding forkhead associated (FHA) protein
VGILVVRKGSHEGRKFPIRPGSSLTFGREGVDIAFQDPGMSRRHCVVESREDGDYLKDLHSTNGTMVNGQKIAEVRLLPGDEICIGFSVLDYLDSDSSSPEDTSGTLVVPAEGIHVSTRPTTVFSVGDIEAAVESDMAAAARPTPPRGNEAADASKPQRTKAGGPEGGTQARATVDAEAAALRERLQEADQAKNYAEQESQVFRHKLDEASTAISAIRGDAEQLRTQLEAAEQARQSAEKESRVLREKYRIVSANGATGDDVGELRASLQEAESAVDAAVRERDEFRQKWEEAHAEHEKSRLETAHLRERLKSAEAECRRLREQSEAPKEGSEAARHEETIEELRQELRLAQQEAHQVRTRFSLREQLVGQLLHEAEEYRRLEAEHKHLVEEHRSVFGELAKRKAAAAKVGELSGELSRAREEALSAQARMRSLEEQIKAVDQARDRADTEREQLIARLEGMQASQPNGTAGMPTGLAVTGSEDLQGIKQQLESIASETRQMHLWMMLKEMLGNKAGSGGSNVGVSDDMVSGLGKKMAQTYGISGAVIPGHAHVVEETTVPRQTRRSPPPPPPPPPPLDAHPQGRPSSGAAPEDKISWLHGEVGQVGEGTKDDSKKPDGKSGNRQDDSEPEESSGPSWL